MRTSTRISIGPFGAAVAFILIDSLTAFVPTPGSAQGSSPRVAASALLLPNVSELAGWTPSGGPEHFEREGLYGYINGGSELFLQYDFRRVDVGRYQKGKGGKTPEITIDLYRMGTDIEAFGIYSISREDGHRTLDSLGLPNWISESQGALAAGSFYVNLIGFETTEKDIAFFARLMGTKLKNAGNKAFPVFARRGPWSELPMDALLVDTVRFIQGPLAAQAESEILAPDFLKFAEGTVAASAKYKPDGRKLILLEFKTDISNLMDRMRNVFAEYLKTIRLDDGVLSAVNASGHVFLFASRGRHAALVFGRENPDAARKLLEAATKQTR